MARVVIVGAGVCGIEAALALRAREPDTKVAIVTDEHDHFFSRPALMYVFSGQMTLRDTEPYDRGLFARLRFERIRGRVTALDTSGRQLALDGGGSVGYDRLLLAVGSKARPGPWPGADGPGVHSFVTLRDLEGLDAGARPGGRAVVIGGGLIGVEAAEILAHRGLHVTFVIRESWYFPVALEAREAALVAEHLRGHGIDVRLEAPVVLGRGDRVVLRRYSPVDTIGGARILDAMPRPRRRSEMAALQTTGSETDREAAGRFVSAVFPRYYAVGAALWLLLLGYFLLAGRSRAA